MVSSTERSSGSVGRSSRFDSSVIERDARHLPAAGPRICPGGVPARRTGYASIVTRAEDQELIEALKRGASVLKAADIPFALAGGFAVYAHGGASSDHDVDF